MLNFLKKRLSELAIIGFLKIIKKATGTNFLANLYCMLCNML